MSRHQDRQTWAIARLLFATHLPLLLIAWVVFAIVVGGIFVGVGIFTTITFSVWHGATQFLRWLALGYGIYLVRQLLPSCIAHGQTRRDFIIQGSLFTVLVAVVLCVLMTLGYVLEVTLYRAMDWQPALTAARGFTASGQLPVTFLTSLAMYLVWTLSGALLGAAFYRSEEWAVVALPLALVLVTMAGFTVGFNGLPFVGRWIAGLDIPRAVAAPLSAGSLLLGLVTTWLIVRDMPIRTRAA